MALEKPGKLGEFFSYFVATLCMALEKPGKLGEFFSYFVATLCVSVVSLA